MQRASCEMRPFNKFRAHLARVQIADGIGEYGIKLGIADRYRAKEEPPILTIAYHDEYRVVAFHLKIGLVDGDLAFDQPAAVTVDAQAFTADVVSGGQVWAVHVAADHTVRQALDSVPRIADE